MMNLNPGSVDSALSIIEAYDKDPGFKNALKKLRAATAKLKASEADTAAFEKRMKTSGDAADKKRIAAEKAEQKLLLKEQGLGEQESELVLARSAFEEESAKARDAQAAMATKQSEEKSALHSLKSDLKRREGALQKKAEKLEADRREFDAWREGLLSALGTRPAA